MSEWLRNIWRSLVLIFVDARPSEPKTRKRKPTNAADIERMGRFYFKRNILDQLDGYFRLIRKIRKFDSDSYDLFAQTGGMITSPKAQTYEGEKHSVLLGSGTKTSSGCLYFERDEKIDDDGDGIVPVRFMYFQKLKRLPSHIEPVTQMVYAVTFVWISEKPYKGTSLEMPGQFHVAILPSNEMRVLKEHYCYQQKIWPKRTKIQRRLGRISHGGPFTIPHWTWRRCETLERIWNSGDKCAKSMREAYNEPEEWAMQYFRYAYELYHNASMDIRVRVQKGSRVAAFAIDLLRTPYFFADRECELAIDGKRKRIFHIVRVHERHLKTGKIVYVKSHFRGLRKFIWNGYKINITMPGKHHSDWLEFDAAGLDVGEDEPIPSDSVGMKELGAGVDRHMNV